MIEVSDLSQVFVAEDGGKVTALTDVSLDIADNEIVTIVGPSGCGKSTLLRLISGLIKPSGGSVVIDGETVKEPRADMGIVFQAPTLLPWATILDNVLFPLKMMGRLDAKATERAKSLLTMVGLGDFMQHRPRQLSGGMQQRAAICRALVHQPKLILMDEPFGALDALTREQMSIELLRIWNADKKTILFVTHSIPEAVLLGDRVVVMSPRPGRIAEIVTVPLSRPRDFESEEDPEFRRCCNRIRNLIYNPNLTAGARHA
ncbi:MAG: ABC transporter ATP-binding protein [Bosea sp.]|uniref:ABC transporter ATP-binding protein n=1 Tax=Bosea sp. (in: a-proteobacteria) TaxID=1871050 RepID=UPI001AC28B59|nr:ABC transporter ATP-binding protein [Bosea sp. (in: a-proteobacteria)]MBN9454135.1 ABC transporter ATP-binding protein [Bosea sp. (in: a-proteobacteria)]